MVTSSYPRFSGDAIATFMEPIATGVAALGHAVHLVAPWTPRWTRARTEAGVTFHLYRYAPLTSLNTFGYAAGLRADTRLRLSAVAVAPLAVMAGWNRTRRVAARTHSALVHAHWVVPSGVIAAAQPSRRPLVISLHGSDVFVAERHGVARAAAHAAFARASWVTACSADLRDRAVALGADAARISVVPYGVDTSRFAPSAAQRASTRASLGLAADAPFVLAFGRLVEKKGFAYLIDATARLCRDFPAITVAIAGAGDLDGALRERARALGLTDRIRLPGMVTHADVPAWLSAADVAVAPSIRDDAGNVDGLPNAVMEILASGTPLVTTHAGGIAAVAIDGRNARIVAERDANALADAIGDLLRDRSTAAALGREARAMVQRDYAWSGVASAFDDIYRRVLERTPAAVRS